MSKGQFCENCIHRIICDHENKYRKVCSQFLEQRPHGVWIKGKEISRTMMADKTLHIDYKDFTCSVCGLVLDRLLYHVDGSPFYNFCPNCGADMREGE